MSLPGLPGLNPHQNQLIAWIKSKQGNDTCSQTNIIELENDEKLDSLSYLYSWRNIMQRFKDLPFDETNTRIVVSEITQWYHRVMQTQELPGGRTDGSGASPQQSDGTGASPQQTDGPWASPQQSDGTGASPQQTDGPGASPQQSDGPGASPQQSDGPGASPRQSDGPVASPQQSDGPEASPQQSDGTGASPRQSDGIAASNEKADGIAASNEKADGIAASLNETNSELSADKPDATHDAGASNIVPYSKKFHDKYRPFISKHQVKKQSNSYEQTCYNSLIINVRRESLFLDSFNLFRTFPPNDRGDSFDLRTSFRYPLNIKFDGELSSGDDNGDKTKEWLSLVSKTMFDPHHGLFKYAANGNTLEINPESGQTVQDHLEYFRFVGRVVGISVFNLKNQLAECYFVRPFYKMMLGKPINLHDMESVDGECFRALQWIKNNDPAGHDLTFTMDENTNGTIVEKELIPGGRYESVTERNKQLYIEKIIDWRFGSRIKEQMQYFMKGFNNVIPLDDIAGIFDEFELEFILSGTAYRHLYLFEYRNEMLVDKYIDVDAWRRNTSYSGYSQDDQVVEWFWTIVKHHFTNETRARLIQLVTGTAKIPNNGVQEHYSSNGPQPFTIKRWGTPENLPTAHISSNRLDLPPYEKFSDLKEKLIEAVDRLARRAEEPTSTSEELGMINVKFVAAHSGKVPRNAFPGGNDGDETLYIGRAEHYGSIIPGKVHPSHGCLYIPYGGSEHKKWNYEVLVQEENRDNLIWVDADVEDAFKTGLPSGAIQSGHEGDGSPMYVARAMMGNQWTVGKFSTRTNTCYVPYGGREHEMGDYQVLCLEGQVDDVVLPYHPQNEYPFPI